MTWTWAQLASDKLQMLEEAERSLGAMILLAYQSAAMANAPRSGPSGLRVAPLNGSQIESLHGLENKLQAVVVAYRVA